MLNAAGQLLGIVVARLNDEVTFAMSGAVPQNVNFAVDLKAVRSFLDQNQISYRAGSEAEMLSGTQLATVAKGFTVSVRCQ